MSKKAQTIIILTLSLLLIIGLLVVVYMLNEEKIQRSFGQIENTAVNENLQIEGLPKQPPKYEIPVVAHPDRFDTSIVDTANNEVIIASTFNACGKATMAYAYDNERQSFYMQPYNPGSDVILQELYVVELQSKSCTRLEISEHLGGFGAKVLSPDQSAMAVVSEEEPRILRLLDLRADTSRVLIEVDEEETLNAGYGALSNLFDIRWIDNNRITYSVYREVQIEDPSQIPNEPKELIEQRLVTAR